MANLRDLALLVATALLAVAIVMLATSILRTVTAVGPSSPAPVTLAPLPSSAPTATGGPVAVPATRHRSADRGPDAGRADPAPVLSSGPPGPTVPSVAPASGVPASLATGLASWYTVGPGIYGAAGPALRVGQWRGRTVQVCSGKLCLDVQLIDFCACGDRPGGPTVIDLSRDAFALLAPPSRGLVEVTVTW